MTKNATSTAIRIEPPLSIEPRYITLRPPWNDCSAEIQLVSMFRYPLLVKLRPSDTQQVRVSSSLCIVDPNQRKPITIQGRFHADPAMLGNLTVRITYRTAPAGTIENLQAAWDEATSTRQDVQVPIAFEEEHHFGPGEKEKDRKKP